MTTPNNAAPQERVQVIAEAGVNHNGDKKLALELVDIAIEAGADIVKFQTFRAEKLVSQHGKKAAYQAKATGDEQESQLAMLKKLELDRSFFPELMAYCKKGGIGFLSTPFEEDSLAFLASELQLDTIKIPSGEITNAPFLLACARTPCNIILSTGMATLGDVEAALAIMAYGMDPSNPEAPPSPESCQESFGNPACYRQLQQRVTLLHCTTEYPAPFADLNLRAITTLAQAFGLKVGFSDHSPGVTAPVMAVALGAQVIEKHFTISKSLPGPDHLASLEPDELKHLVQSIREAEAALGDGRKIPRPSEIPNMAIARKSLVATATIKEGELITAANLGSKRPGDGISPFRYWQHLNRRAQHSYQAGDALREF